MSRVAAATTMTAEQPPHRHPHLHRLRHQQQGPLRHPLLLLLRQPRRLPKHLHLLRQPRPRLQQDPLRPPRRKQGHQSQQRA
ncbi:MAG: hypothetical protein OXK79_11500 [Chloroflexota bacterium]|nr:hypothetical protein [Chloroflexota bacterium]